MTLTDLIANARCLLIDFDGPVCSVFAGHPATAVAADLHAVIRRYFNGEIPSAMAKLTSDPLRTLVEVAVLGDEQLIRQVAKTCRDGEVAAIVSAVPTPGADDALRAAQDAGRLVAIVSNNASEAINAYLKHYDLVSYVNGLAARVGTMHPRLLKPHPFLLDRGLAATGAHRGEAVFIGDSVTDIEAGQAAGIPTIGFANKPGKNQRLADAGADAVIDSMAALTKALRQSSARPAQ